VYIYICIYIYIYIYRERERERWTRTAARRTGDETHYGYGQYLYITFIAFENERKLGRFVLFRQMDRVEINEAFAPQVLACAKALGIDTAKLNVGRQYIYTYIYIYEYIHVHIYIYIYIYIYV